MFKNQVPKLLTLLALSVVAGLTGCTGLQVDTDVKPGTTKIVLKLDGPPSGNQYSTMNIECLQPSYNLSHPSNGEIYIRRDGLTQFCCYPPDFPTNPIILCPKIATPGEIVGFTAQGNKGTIYFLPR
jgi:hypothetical protein